MGGEGGSEWQALLPSSSTPISFPVPGPPSSLLQEGSAVTKLLKAVAVGGWLLRTISCLWLTTASCSELQHLTPIKFFPPRGGRCHEGLTSFVGLETQAFQQLKKRGSQVSGYLASPGPSEGLESRRTVKLLLDRFWRGEESNSASLPWGKDLTFLLACLRSGWELTSLLHLGGTFSFQMLGGF